MRFAKPVLTYFNDSKGRNELIRLIFAAGHMDYVNEEISALEYFRRRDAGKLPYGQLPTLRLADGLVLGQSCAIARYAARLTALYPHDHVKAAQADAVIDAWRDQLDQFYDVLFERAVIGGKRQMIPRPQLQRAPLLQKYLKFSFQPWLVQMEMQLSNGFVCPPQLCFADLAIFDLVRTIECTLEPRMFHQLMKAHHRVKNLVAHIEQIPEVVQHLRQHPYVDIQCHFTVPSFRQQAVEGLLTSLMKALLGTWWKIKGYLSYLCEIQRALLDRLPSANACQES
eukprot:TRINITY_DN21283_c0_g1_i1.p1 TRINITY_DN21283_c0_g1~~TRINITY_DN21283_c0_g1_i1.p1  ORF type:complete len:283 (+),score=33.52 TRINITY_DN21283_c0_g1_i1:137-985(+)